MWRNRNELYKSRVVRRQNWVSQEHNRLWTHWGHGAAALGLGEASHALVYGLGSAARLVSWASSTSESFSSSAVEKDTWTLSQICLNYILNGHTKTCVSSLSQMCSEWRWRSDSWRLLPDHTRVWLVKFHFGGGCALAELKCKIYVIDFIKKQIQVLGFFENNHISEHRNIRLDRQSEEQVPRSPKAPTVTEDADVLVYWLVHPLTKACLRPESLLYSNRL